MTAENILKLNYTDFIGLINQWNVMPGAYETINRWATFGHVTKESRTLELACTTGFSTRELSLLTGCSGIGVDISSASIEKAKLNKDIYSPNSDIEFFAQDAYQYQPQGSFSHLIVGAALRFFPNPSSLLGRYIPYLHETAYLLSAEFYVDQKIPAELMERAKRVFNIYPTNTDYKSVMSVYEGLELYYEHRAKPVPETEEELTYYCKSTIDRTVNQHPELDFPEIRDAMFNRLYEIKEMSNILRQHQSYSVLVHRYRKSLYPNRFVELF